MLHSACLVGTQHGHTFGKCIPLRRVGVLVWSVYVHLQNESFPPVASNCDCIKVTYAWGEQIFFSCSALLCSYGTYGAPSGKEVSS